MKQQQPLWSERIRTYMLALARTLEGTSVDTYHPAEAQDGSVRVRVITKKQACTAYKAMTGHAPYKHAPCGSVHGTRSPYTKRRPYGNNSQLREHEEKLLDEYLLAVYGTFRNGYVHLLQQRTEPQAYADGGVDIKKFSMYLRHVQERAAHEELAAVRAGVPLGKVPNNAELEAMRNTIERMRESFTNFARTVGSFQSQLMHQLTQYEKGSKR